MRLIAQFSSGEKVFGFSNFLFRMNISNQYEEAQEEGRFSLWVHCEEDLEQATQYYQEFLQSPEDSRFLRQEIPVRSAVQKEPSGKALKRAAGLSIGLVHWVLALCAILFIWDMKEASDSKKEANGSSFALDLELTSVERTLLFDEPQPIQQMEAFFEKYPVRTLEEIKKEPKEVQRAFHKALNAPFWKGEVSLLLEKMQTGYVDRSAPLFEKIRQGEVWRAISPSFLHKDFLHLFFNMAWLLLLGKQIEERLKKSRMILLIVVVAAFSNVMQYLVSGPYFLGFSGVVAGFAGFIWSRQKKAPWEGYPLHKSTISFLFYLIIVLSFIGVLCFILQMIGMKEFSFPIANTAHIAGGIMGCFLGRLSFFARRIS